MAAIGTELGSLTHIEIDVAHTYFVNPFPAESPRIRTGGSLSSSHRIPVRLPLEWPETISTPENGGIPAAYQTGVDLFHSGRRAIRPGT